MNLGLKTSLVALSGCAYDICRQIAARFKSEGAFAYGCDIRASLTGIQVYCAAKRAVLGLTRQLAHKVRPILVVDGGR